MLDSGVAFPYSKIQGGQRLGVGGGDEKRIGIDLRRFAQLLHAEPAFVDNFAAVDEGKGHAGDAELLHAVFHECFQGRDARSVERMGLPASERFALVSLRAQAADRERELRAALLVGGLGRIDDDHRPRGAGARRRRVNDRALVGRSLVLVGVPLFPAVARRFRRGDLERAFRIGTIGGPRGGDRGVGVRRLHVDDRQARVGLGRLEEDHVGTRLQAPVRRRGECHTGRRGARLVGRKEGKARAEEEGEDRSFHVSSSAPSRIPCGSSAARRCRHTRDTPTCACCTRIR